MVLKVCVIGAGIIGLSSAIQIQERLGQQDITLVADKFSPETTGDGSGGFWKPHMLGETPISDIRRWSVTTWQHLTDIATSPLAAQAGASTVSGYSLSSRPQYQEEWWKDLVLGYRHLSPRELQMFPDAKSGVFFTTVQINAVAYMDYLLRRFQKNGGKLQMKTITSIDEVAYDYDVVVNCSGIRARHLLGDLDVVPVRGHLTRVRAPWVKHFVLRLDPGEEAFVLPGVLTSVLGGADEVGNWSTEVREEDKTAVWQRCCQLMPSLQDAQVDHHWVGLRPSRSRVRLETSHMTVQGRAVPVIHNYGHGGSGVTLHWGCAVEAADLVLREIQARRPMAKL
ncbi:D-aspartate oxidase-like [Haliotis rufescens]|uniref:D-aspartate oxidase-like n=1 Tax=Haliotis rufescens TaxID=6454 RepID=UPI00201F8204|nr:D-aspartate oxidase-like [Haliotis rufescens]XP_048255431.1 D-aspartate oxidase-like [Haliotis rufescens]